MKIELRFFAGLREALGVAQENLTVPPEVTTVGQLRQLLQARGGVWADALADTRALRTAFNHALCGNDTVLCAGCEVAFFPPVTGG
jgi:molybdopterin synthase sulfur carrier subunit